MAAMGPTAFTVVLWGSLLGVFLVFCHEMAVMTRDIRRLE
jgi:hypothetical protein